MKNYLIPTLLISATSVFASVNQPPFLFEKSKDYITSIRNSSIKLGESINLTGEDTQIPGVYLEDKGSSFTAYRLSIVPPQTFDRWKPYLQCPTENSIVVSWKDDGLNLPTVSYGEEPSSLNNKQTGIIEVLSDEKATINFNKVTLSNLKPNTKYYYQVSGDDEIYSFRTFPDEKSSQKIRVLFMGDHHMPERSSYEWLIASAKEVIQKKYGAYEDYLNVVMNLGDQVDRGWLDQYERNHFYKSSYLSTSIPIMTTVGNHDVYEDEKLEKYSKLYSYETLSYQGLNSGTDAYYAYRCGSLLFIVMNTESTYANEVQLSWIREVIEKADKDESIQFVISTCHRPMCSETWIDDDSPWLRNIVSPILGSSSKFVLNLAGHHHYYHRGQMENQNFHHIVTGGAAWDQLWANAPTVFDQNLIQKTHDYWTYVLTEFDPVAQQMVVETYSIGHTYIGHNNLLIDRFVRDLNDKKKPSKPELNNIDKNPEFPLVISANAPEDTNDFNTSHFQIATDSDFENLLVDKMLHFENFHKDGGAPYYLPANTQKNNSCYAYEVNEPDLDTGIFYVRVRYRNQNLMWSDWSDIKQFEVDKQIEVTPDVEPLVSFEKTLYKKGEPIQVNFKNVPVGTGAWIGLYQQRDEIPGVGSVGYAYTDPNSNSETPGTGVVSFLHSQHGVPLPAGKFFFILFGDSGYDLKLTPRMEFNITESDELVELTTDKKHYQVGEPIQLSFKGATGNSTDWIGFYLTKNTVGEHNTDLYKYIPASQVNGVIEFNEGLPAGCYYVSYFVNDSYEERSQRHFINVGNKPELYLPKNTFDIEEDICFQLKNMPEYPLCWLTVIDKETSSEVYRRFIKTDSRNINIFSKFKKGDYEVNIIIPNNQRVIDPVSFSVLDQLNHIDKISSNNIYFYPNPVSNNIYVDNDIIQRIQIFDYKGLLVFESEIKEKQVDLNMLPSGFYIIRMKGGEAVYEQILIKK